ncbi:MAG: hypothetical protein OEY64_05225 [Nitrospinota bacterium]|nr:hypothetical protein [Nitrospinota bacterium]
MRKIITVATLAIALSLFTSPALTVHAKEKAGKTCCGGKTKEQCKIDMGENCPMDMSEEGDTSSKEKQKNPEQPTSKPGDSKKGNI